MSIAQVQSPSADERLWTLVAANCDGTISDAQRLELETLLIDDESARLFYAAYMDLHGRLLWRFRSQTGERGEGRGERGESGEWSVESEIQRPKTQDLRPDISGQWPVISGQEGAWGEGRGARNVEYLEIPNLQISKSPNPQIILPTPHAPHPSPLAAWAFSYSVATLFLAVALLGAWFATITHPNPDTFAKNIRSVTPSENITKDPSQFTFVGHVSGMIDCQWSEPSTSTVPGAEVSLGRRYALKSGLMEIEYTSGAKVILQGPCEYTVESVRGGFLGVGKLVARVGAAKPQAAASRIPESPNPRIPNPEIPKSLNPQIPKSLFAVRTPTAVVEDLGTEFGVEVNERGETVSHVFQGQVVMRTEGAGAGGQGSGTENPKSKIQNPKSKIILSAGQSARVERSAAGSAVLKRADASPANAFVRRLPRFVPIKVFSTGRGLHEGNADPHWQVIARSDQEDFKPQAAVVTAGHYFWMSNTPSVSQWISLENGPPDLPDGVTYTFRTTFELPSPPAGAKLRVKFIVDNHVRAIRLNGKELSVPEHGYEYYIGFTEMQITDGFVAGKNVLEFEVSNGRETPEPGELSSLGLRVELQGAAIQGDGSPPDKSLNKQELNQTKKGPAR